MRSAELYHRLEGISEDAFVLHGSPQILTHLEPRQTSFNTAKAFSKYGLYATTCVEIALLYALIHDTRDAWGWKWDPANPSPIRVEAFDNCRYGPGYIYVVHRKPFRTIKGNPLIQITQKTESNAVFAIIPKQIVHELKKHHFFYIWDEKSFEARLMLSFDSKESDILNFAQKIKELLRREVL